ncbi:hypothetical protein M758_11G108000 [Ceratodon purpureus]|nr:hypothetical protein M758_11G108000 [Ceratodon purpureus]
MGPKKKGKGKKGKKGKVKADPGWARTIEWGYWSRPYESMPSAAVKPAFGVIREEFLEAVKELDMIWSKTLTEDFLVELFSIPRPNLVSARYGNFLYPGSVSFEEVRIITV